MDYSTRAFVDQRDQALENHIKSLSSTEQEFFETGTHPSFSHSFRSDAEPYATALDKDLRDQCLKAAVSIGLFHGDEIVLNVELNENEFKAADIVKRIPLFYHGFKVKIIRELPRSST